MDSDAVALLFSLVLTFGTFGCMILACTLPLIVAIGVPLMKRKTFLGWTRDRSSKEAWEAIMEGATTGIIQIFPATYVFEETLRDDEPPKAVLDRIEARLGQTFMVKCLGRDDDGVMINWRWPEEVGPGWVGVVLAEPDGGGSRLRCRFRSTFSFPFPVLTPFLSLSLRMNLARYLG